MIKMLIELFIDDKTLYRVMFNKSLERLTIDGNVIDIGAKTSNASYYKHLNKKNTCKFTFTDLHQDIDKSVIKLDATKDFELSSNIFDNVLCFNLLEHLPQHDTFLNESYRILKVGGKMIIAVPFLYPFHPDPNDYLRFTDEYLINKCEQIGFKYKETIFNASGPFSTFSDFLIYLSLPKIIRLVVRPFILSLSFLLDNVVKFYRPTYNNRKLNETFASGFIIVFTKDNASNEK